MSVPCRSGVLFSVEVRRRCLLQVRLLVGRCGSFVRCWRGCLLLVGARIVGRDFRPGLFCYSVVKIDVVVRGHFCFGAGGLLRGRPTGLGPPRYQGGSDGTPYRRYGDAEADCWEAARTQARRRYGESALQTAAL